MHFNIDGRLKAERTKWTANTLLPSHKDLEIRCYRIRNPFAQYLLSALQIMNAEQNINNVLSMVYSIQRDASWRRRVWSMLHD